MRKTVILMATRLDFVQIGTTAIRDPATGALMESVPLFVKVDDAARVEAVTISGDELARTLAAKFAEYKRQNKKTC
jgi:hypothetical protein